MRSAETKALKRAMNRAIKIHNEKPSRYYLRDGAPCGIEECYKVLHELKSLSRYQGFFLDSGAVPEHPLFVVIKSHLNRLRCVYKDEELKVTQLFLLHILPRHPMPFRFCVLSTMTLFATKVYVHDESLYPMTRNARIDGYFDFVIDLGDDVIRIPLLGESQVKKLPGGLRFASDKSGNSGKTQRLAEYVFGTAPTTGRRSQFHAFISILNRDLEQVDFMPSLMNAIMSLDMSFAIAICALASDIGSVAYNIVSFLSQAKLFDHFLRCVTAASMNAIRGYVTHEIPEVFALVNVFVAMGHNWAHMLSRRCQTSGDVELTTIISEICCDIRSRRVPESALYVLQTALNIAMHEDGVGESAALLFMEVVVRPFSKGLGLEDAYLALKYEVARGRDKSVTATIEHVLRMDITFEFCGDPIDEQLFEIHHFVIQKLDEFVRLVILLNGRHKYESVLMQMLLFTFMKTVERTRE